MIARRALGVLLAAALVSCSTGQGAPVCGQGVDRDVCERIAAFAVDASGVESDAVNVQARNCERYYDTAPPDARCWSVRIGESRVVAVTDAGDGTLREATELFPLEP